MHVLDLAVQEQYGVQYHTYWFDPSAGTVFCLAEGPSREALDAVHQEAHGLMADSILEVDPTLPLNHFFGGFPQFPAGVAYTAPAIRAIVFTDLRGSVAQTIELGDDGHLALLREHDHIVRTGLTDHDGREVKHTGDGIMACFNSVASALNFAVNVQRALHARNQDTRTRLDVGIGISAGEPVTDDHNDLFGAAVQLAARLCEAAAPGEIIVSVVARELSIGKPFRFDDHGKLDLKGLPEPIQAYRVSWHV